MRWRPSRPRRAMDMACAHPRLRENRIWDRANSATGTAFIAQPLVTTTPRSHKASVTKPRTEPAP